MQNTHAKNKHQLVSGIRDVVTYVEFTKYVWKQVAINSNLIYDLEPLSPPFPKHNAITDCQYRNCPMHIVIPGKCKWCSICHFVAFSCNFAQTTNLVQFIKYLHWAHQLLSVTDQASGLFHMNYDRTGEGTAATKINNINDIKSLQHRCIMQQQRDLFPSVNKSSIK